VGQVQLGNLPRTRKWAQVVALIEGGAGTVQLANATISQPNRDCGSRLRCTEHGRHGTRTSCRLIVKTASPIDNRRSSQPGPRRLAHGPFADRFSSPRGWRRAGPATPAIRLRPQTDGRWRAGGLRSRPGARPAAPRPRRGVFPHAFQARRTGDGRAGPAATGLPAARSGLASRHGAGSQSTRKACAMPTW